ncbi:MAG: hypothetical protein LBC86_06495 [Oscillospiraceae bacterium]|jgi:hypothetical protein|nr:hypothetical protein [Oscillospiraceae bacterium]
MFCIKCGVALGEKNIFCHTCGSKITKEPEPAGFDIFAEPPEPETAPPAPPPFNFNLFPPEAQPVPEEVFLAIEALEASLPSEQRTVSITGRKEKEYFGFPALIFCLTIIGILSAACGVLAILYFGGL